MKMVEDDYAFAAKGFDVDLPGRNIIIIKN